jgi:hypothetical protein
VIDSIPSSWSANLTLEDYGRVARHPPELLDAEGAL